MILVDTTVWIDFFNGIQTPEKKAFEALLRKGSLICMTDVILTEILRGVVKDSEHASMKAYLADFPCLTAKPPKTFIHAADLYRKCRKQGSTVRSSIDCLIAAVCLEHQVELLHHDADFLPIAKWCGLKLLNPASVS